MFENVKRLFGIGVIEESNVVNPLLLKIERLNKRIEKTKKRIEVLEISLNDDRLNSFRPDGFSKEKTEQYLLNETSTLNWQLGRLSELKGACPRDSQERN